MLQQVTKFGAPLKSTSVLNKSTKNKVAARDSREYIARSRVLSSLPDHGPSLASSGLSQQVTIFFI